MQPLFDSVNEDFSRMADKMRRWFWKLGSSTLNAVRVGAIYDAKASLHPRESFWGNFDIVIITAERLRIIIPILKPHVTERLMNGMREKGGKY